MSLELWHLAHRVEKVCEPRRTNTLVPDHFTTLTFSFFPSFLVFFIASNSSDMSRKLSMPVRPIGIDISIGGCDGEFGGSMDSTIATVGRAVARVSGAFIGIIVGVPRTRLGAVLVEAIGSSIGMTVGLATGEVVSLFVGLPTPTCGQNSCLGGSRVVLKVKKMD